MLSNKTVDVSHPTVLSELFPQNENKNQNCLEQKNYQQLALSIMATQAYEAYVEEEDVTTERRKKL